METTAPGQRSQPGTRQRSQSRSARHDTELVRLGRGRRRSRRARYRRVSRH